MGLEHARILARLDEDRYLARCSCRGGIYHLVWGPATYRLTPQGLLALRQALDRVLALGDGGVVWLGPAGLRFSRAEGEELRALLALDLKAPTLQDSSPRFAN